jgi:hypothetical protein
MARVFGTTAKEGVFTHDREGRNRAQGSGAAWPDLVAYAVGIAAGVVAELAARKARAKGN